MNVKTYISNSSIEVSIFFKRMKLSFPDLSIFYSFLEERGTFKSFSIVI